MCRCFRYLLICAAAVLASASPSMAAVQHWRTSPANQDFGNDANWDPGSSATTDDYYVDVAGSTTYPIVTYSPVSTVVNQLNIGVTDGAYTGAGKVGVTGTLLANGDMIVGGNGSLSATSYLTIDIGYVGAYAGLLVGTQGGTGRIDMANYAQISVSGSGTMDIGNETGTGTLVASNSYINFGSTGRLGVGYRGNGTMTLQAGSSLTTTGGEMQVGGWSSTADGTVNMIDSTFNKGAHLLVGQDAGKGTFNMTGSSTMYSTAGVIQVGRYSTADNTFNMGPGTTLSHSGEDVCIGFMDGTGTFNMTGGTFNQTAAQLFVGANYWHSASHGYFNLSGDAKYNLSGGGSLVVGNNGCFGEMTMTGTAQVNQYAGTFYVGDGGTGTLTMTGGTVTLVDPNSTAVADFRIGANGTNSTGTVNIGTDSTIIAAGFSVGYGANNTGTLSMTSNGKLYKNYDCVIGMDSGNGTMTMSGDSRFYSDKGNIQIGRWSTVAGGNKLTMSGTAEIIHAGVKASADNADVIIGHYGGTGTLEMTGASKFTQTTRALYVGYTYYSDTASRGYLNMSGTSTYTMNGSNNMVVGHQNCFGTVTLTEGSTFDFNSTGKLYIGYNNGNGTIALNGGSTFNQNSADYTYIGYNGGTGTLSLIGSAAGVTPVTTATFSGSAAIRVGNSGTGTISMGQNSVLNASNYLVIGGDSTTGTGTLTMTGNAIINKIGTNSMFVGEVGGTGTATLSNTATINCAGDVEVGKRTGFGTVTMNDNSAISLTGGRSFYIGYGSDRANTLTMNDSSDLTTKSLNIGKYFKDGKGTEADPYVYRSGVGTLYLGEGVSGEDAKILLAESGGVIHVGSSYGSTQSAGQLDCSGTVVMKGGSFDASAVDATFAPTINAFFGYGSGSSATWTQDGGTATVPTIIAASSESAAGSTANGASATFNFNGGVFATNSIRPHSSGSTDKGKYGSLTINFNGGTIQARQSTTYFIYRREMEAANCHVNVKPLGGTIDANGQPGRFRLGAEVREAITSLDAAGTAITTPGAGGTITITDTNTVAPGTGVISFSGDNAGFVGNIIVKEGTLAGGGNIGGNGIDPPEDTGGGPIEPSGNNAFGLGNATRTITVETGGTLAFRYSGMYTNNYTISDYCATQIPTINVDGGTLAVQPIVAEKTDETTVPSTYYYAYHEERATVNNVTLNNGLMTSQTGTTIGSNPGTYAWFVNGTLTSKGESTINCSLSATPVSPGAPARTVIDALVALQSGDMANPKTTFDVQNGTLSVYSTLTDGLNSTAHATAPGAPHATGLTKTGAGTMSILGNLTYTGNTDIQNGTLEIATATPITLNTVTGASSAGTLKVCDGATLTATSIQVDTLVIGGLATAASSASVAAVPEPGTLVMLVLAAAALAGVCIRRK